MNELEIIERWVKIGFTDGFKNVRNLALALETAAKNIINNFETEVKTEFDVARYETLIFPAIRRIFEKNTDALDMDITKIEEEVNKIEAEFKTWLSTVDIEAEKLKNKLVDVEAEMLAKFCDEYDKFVK